MSEKRPESLTHHAMLVAWEQLTQSNGLIQKIEAVALHQMKVEHRPQSKILEFSSPFWRDCRTSRNSVAPVFPLTRSKSLPKRGYKPVGRITTV